MASTDHAPSLGSRLMALRNPARYQPTCRVDGHTWPCPIVIEGDRWNGDGPVPDGTDAPPLDFIQAAQGGFFRLARTDRGEPWRPV